MADASWRQHTRAEDSGDREGPASAYSAQQDLRASRSSCRSGHGGAIPQQRPFLPQYLFSLRRQALRPRSLRGGHHSFRALRPTRHQLPLLNIHAEMSAVVVVVTTPYYAISNSSGNISIQDVPDGRYQLHVWYERTLPEDLKSLAAPVTISHSERSLGAIKVIENPNFTLAHKNKYGQDYVPPPSPGYTSP